MYNTLGIARRGRKFVGAEGAKAKRVLIDGVGADEARNTAAANAGALAGVSFDSARDGDRVALSEYGYAEIESAGVINPGERVNVAADGGVAANRGRVKTVSEAAGTVINLVGVAVTGASAAGEFPMINLRRFGQTYTA